MGASRPGQARSFIELAQFAAFPDAVAGEPTTSTRRRAARGMEQEASGDERGKRRRPDG